MSLPQPQRRLNSSTKLAEQTNKTIEDSLLGYGFINFAFNEAQVIFNSSNPRALQTSQVKGLEKYIEQDGLQNNIPAHALICQVSEATIDKSSLKPSTASSFSSVVFAKDIDVQDIKLNFLAGQHRHSWLITTHCKDNLQQWNKVKEVHNKFETNSEAWRKNERCYESLKEGLESCKWLVAFYSEGE